MSRPLVSVIVPSYNTGKFIGAAIESALAQSWRELEVIVVDNHSTDETTEVLAGISDARVRSYPIHNNGVIAKSRNAGVREARGAYLAFLDSDDVWEPGKLEKQLEHLQNPAISCVGTNISPIGDTARFVNHLSFAPGTTHRDYGRFDLLTSNPVVNSSAVVRRVDFERIGELDERPNFRAIEDWDLWMRFAQIGTVRVLAEPLVKYRIAYSLKRDTRQVTINSLEVVKKNSMEGVPTNIRSQALGNCYVNIGRAFLEHGDRKGVGYYWRGLGGSRGFRNTVRCLWGLSMFCLPAAFRKQIMASAYGVHAALRSNRSVTEQHLDIGAQ